MTLSVELGALKKLAAASSVGSRRPLVTAAAISLSPRGRDALREQRHVVHVQVCHGRGVAELPLEVELRLGDARALRNGDGPRQVHPAAGDLGGAEEVVRLDTVADRAKGRRDVAGCLPAQRQPRAVAVAGAGLDQISCPSGSGLPMRKLSTLATPTQSLSTESAQLLSLKGATVLF